MTKLVDPGLIEKKVGVLRHQSHHYGRAISDEGRFYILHSWDCISSNADLRECRYSLALDRGIDLNHWSGMQNIATPLAIQNGSLVPLGQCKYPHGAHG